MIVRSTGPKPSSCASILITPTDIPSARYITPTDIPSVRVVTVAGLPFVQATTHTDIPSVRVIAPTVILSVRINIYRQEILVGAVAMLMSKRMSIRCSYQFF